MQKIFDCIDLYIKDLERDILKIVDDQKIPMMEKNRLMEPIADQKKVLIYTKESLLKIKNRDYEAKCNMGANR